MTTEGLAAATSGRLRGVASGLAEFIPRTTHSVSRPIRTTPPLRPFEPPLSPSRRDVLRRWEDEDVWQCTYCDVAACLRVVLEVDHVHPLAKGGQHIWANLAPACGPCNRAKGDTEVGLWPDVSTGQSSTERSPQITDCQRKPFHSAVPDIHQVTGS
ncbi:HNH endonuclease [Streptomyces spectabilis]|uniref:HNH endonuclease n=1 Tax=Streptomyces spectabilis TaxID=68270 RepID=UPI0033F5D747